MTALPSIPTARLAATLLSSQFSQHARLITIDAAQDHSISESIVVERFTGHESVNELFCFDIDLLSVSSSIDFKDLIGRELTLGLLQADGSRRVWHGYCTAASFLGDEAGIARHRLKLSSFFAFFKLRHDSHIFQDKSALDIVADICTDYPEANVRFDVSKTIRQRTICTQYRESDFSFICRLLASEGLSWRFEHPQAGDVTGRSGRHAQHQLVIFDSEAPTPALSDGGEIRFHHVAATERTDSIDGFSAVRRLSANSASVSSWDRRALVAYQAEANTALSTGDLPVLGVYDVSREGQYPGSEAANQRAAAMLRAAECGVKSWEGTGAVRSLAAGHAFTLLQHEHYAAGENAFKVCSVSHVARNNVTVEGWPLPGQRGLALKDSLQSTRLADVEEGTYRNAFVCVREAVPIVPPPVSKSIVPVAPGPQIAQVVGLPGAAHTIGRDHCIRLQFPWQRGVAPNAGGLEPDGKPTSSAAGNAPGNERSGTWIPVAEALAGPNWGTVFAPRIGSEVLVDFMGSDMDCPVIVAQLYNGVLTPPFAAGVDGDTNHAGYLSGWHSHALDRTGGYNEWVVDDASNQMRLRLATSSAYSEVNFGHLLHQQAGSAHRGSYRGSGFEVRSDGWAVVCGAEGLLLSTTARSISGSSPASTQMDTREALSWLRSTAELGGALSDVAGHQGAWSSEAVRESLAALMSTGDPQKNGKHASIVNGQTAFKVQMGTRIFDNAQPVDHFAEPLVVVDAAASISLASMGPTGLYVGQQIQCSAQGDNHFAAAHTISNASGKSMSLFAHAGGFGATAASGPLLLRAHTNQLEILADQSITVTSVNDAIAIAARERIVVQAGQSSVSLDGNSITFACPGQFSVKGAAHPFGGGASLVASLEPLPSRIIPAVPPSHSLFEKYDEQIVYKGPHSERLADMPFDVRNATDAEQKEASTTPDQGETQRIDTDGAQPLNYALRYAAFVFRT